MRLILALLLPRHSGWSCRILALLGAGHSYSYARCDPPSCRWCGRTRPT